MAAACWRCSRLARLFEDLQQTPVSVEPRGQQEGQTEAQGSGPLSVHAALLGSRERSPSRAPHRQTQASLGFLRSQTLPGESSEGSLAKSSKGIFLSLFFFF